MSELEPPSGGHELVHPPVETVPGWIVECICGWTNQMAPADSADAALDQFSVHRG